MKQGGRPTTAGGFTIVETLIVLAVSGLMFVSAVLYIGGKQNKTEFFTAANSLQQQLQQTINETASGYPGGSTFSCVGSTNNANPLGISNSGISNNCTFVGKAIQFGVDHDNNKIVIWPLVGNQQIYYGSAKQQVQSVTDAHPTAVYNALNPGGAVDGSTTVRLENGLTVVSATPRVAGVAQTQVGGFAFITSFGNYSGGSQLSAGAQQFSGYAVKSTSVNQSKADFTAAVNQPANLVAADITMCVQSGSTDQFAMYTITGDGLNVSMQIARACS